MKKNKNKLSMISPYILYTVIALSFILGVIYPIINILTFLLLCVYIIGEKNHSKIVNLLVFMAPLAPIFKVSADATSLYTYLTFIYIIKMLTIKPINKKFIFIYFFFIIYCAIGFKYGYTAVLKVLSIPLLLYYFLHPDENIDKISIIKTFIFALIISSFIGYFKNYLPNMNNYIFDKSLRISSGVYTNRFSGLNGDPNYYSVNILLGLSLILYLLIKKGITIKNGIILIFLLVLFGSQTNSKIFLLTLSGMSLIAIYALFKNKRYFFGFLFAFGIIIFAYLLITAKIPIFNTVLNRFESNSSLSELTTKRSDIAISYFNFFNNNPMVYFWGNGFNNLLINNKAPHNTYIDFIYNFGIIGSMLFMYIILFNTRFYKKKKNIVNYLPLIIILVSYLSLSELKYNDFSLHLFLVILVIIGEKKQKNDKTYLANIGSQYTENQN